LVAPKGAELAYTPAAPFAEAAAKEFKTWADVVQEAHISIR
jgi:hypothetical protein